MTATRGAPAAATTGGGKTRRPYAEALDLAHTLRQAVQPYTERLEIAGSIRRETDTVGDIEIVIIPRYESPLDLFGNPGEPVSLLRRALATLPGVQSVTKNGERYQQVLYQPDAAREPIQVDLFNATALNWGLILALRTGNGDFSKWLVTDRKHGGGKPKHLTVTDGEVRAPDGRAVPVPSELALFTLYGLKLIPVDQRYRGYWGWDALQPWLLTPTPA